ncbi:MAG: hypothetical protein BGO69_08570 [Bacteroidetes bacterium 46-16]|nr:MAG: hypothetical protein BGO69_08570 [Bacteroidetes bacterium 46-16]
MRLYRKQLNSIEELRREKAALQLLRKKTEQEDIFSMKDIVPSFGKKEKSDKDDEYRKEAEGLFASVKDMLGGLDIATLLPLILNPLEAIAGKKIRNKIILPLLKELVGSYLKWKAVELGFDAIKHFAKKKKKKREAREEGA